MCTLVTNLCSLVSCIHSDNLNNIRYAAYRTALKIRAVQSVTKRKSYREKYRRTSVAERESVCVRKSQKILKGPVSLSTSSSSNDSFMDEIALLVFQQ